MTQINTFRYFLTINNNRPKRALRNTFGSVQYIYLVINTIDVQLAINPAPPLLARRSLSEPPQRLYSNVP